VSAIVVITTVGTQEQANLIAEELVGQRRAACVNVLTIARSVYRWQGRVCDDSEYLLIIKTLESEYERVEETIRELHQYELPEILQFRVTGGEAGFLSWISKNVGAGQVAGNGDWPPGELGGSAEEAE
jgi:periplasmic divalent cation tolerance protein